MYVYQKCISWPNIKLLRLFKQQQTKYQFTPLEFLQAKCCNANMKGPLHCKISLVLSGIILVLTGAMCKYHAKLVIPTMHNPHPVHPCSIRKMLQFWCRTDGATMDQVNKHHGIQDTSCIIWCTCYELLQVLQWCRFDRQQW